MNLKLMKAKRVAMGGKGRGEIRSEAGQVPGVVANVPTTDTLGKRYKAFSGWEIAARKLEIFQFGRFDVNSGTET